MDWVTPETLAGSMERGGQFLRNSVLSDGAHAGFPEIAGGRQIRPWGGTADGLLGLHYAGEALGSPLAARLADWLYDAQDPTYGSWESRGVPLVDATAAVLIALLAVKQVREEELRRALAFVLKHESEGGFAPALEASPRVFTTCLATWALRATQLSGLDELAPGRLDRSLESAAGWLVQSRTHDGAWGSLPDPGEGPSLAHTGIALHVLSLLSTRDRQAENEAANWLRISSDAALPTRVELHRVGPRDIEIRTVHLNYAWALIGLCSQKVSVLDEDAQRFARLLLDSQDTSNGAFLCSPSHGDPPVAYIWATARSLHALSRFQRQITSEASVIDLSSRVLRLESTTDKLLREGRQHRRGIRLLSAAVLLLTLLCGVLVWQSGAYELAVDAADTVGSFAAALWRDQGWYAVVFAVVCIPLLALLTWLFLKLSRLAIKAVTEYFDIEF